MKKYAIIVAGGTGTRMGKVIPKQFLILNNAPILIHTIRRFFEYDNRIEIILVLPKAQIEYWKKLCENFDFNIKHKIVEGGSTRFYSVRNGLKLISENGLVAVHDGVRPLVSRDLINRCYIKAMEKGNAIPCIKVKDSLKVFDKNGCHSVDRDYYRAVQTPQVFYADMLKNAYSQSFSDNFTDDASVYESKGNKLYMVEGEETNIKITTQLDLKIAEILLNNKF